MPVPTPTARRHSLQLDSDHPVASSGTAEIPDPEGRKRRRITPTNSVPVPAVLQDAGPSHGFSLSSLAQPTTWDYLVKWEGEDDSIVGDIEEEEYYSDVSNESPGDLEDTVQDGKEGDDMSTMCTATISSRLGEDRVAKIINDCIEKYAEAWMPGKDETKHKDEAGQTEVPVVYDAFELWTEAENAGQREELADKYEEEAKYYRQRLDVLCEEIWKDPGHTEAGIRMKCRNLEVTVDMLERATWLEGIYKLPPETKNDDESQDDDAQILDQTEPSVLQTSDHRQRSHLIPQVIDLGSRSTSECSDDEGVPLSDILTTSLQIEHTSKPGRVIESRPLSSDPVVLDTVEAPNLSVARSRAPLGDAPERASIASVSRWSWAQLEETQDRKRAVSRAVYEMSSTDRETVRQRLQKVGRTNMIREIPACVDMLSRGDKRMPGILPQDLPKVVTFTKLFLCWWLCGNYLQKEPPEAHLEELARCLRQRSPDPSTFCDYLDTILSTTFSLEALDKPTQPSQAEVIEISDDDEPPAQVLNRRRAYIDKPSSAHKDDPIFLG